MDNPPGREVQKPGSGGLFFLNSLKLGQLYVPIA